MPNPPTPNHDWVRNARVGAVTLLPYFGVMPDPNSKIDKATFISKAKAALSYYEHNIAGNRTINALYYLGDDTTKDYPNDPGESGQRNDAHFMELVAALSVIDFMNMGCLATQHQQRPGGAAYLQRIWHSGKMKNYSTFTHLGDETQALIESR